MSYSAEAAAYLAYFAYIDADLAAPVQGDFASMLKQTGSVANGPWQLVWGPSFNDGILSYVAKGADGSLCLAFRGTNTDYYVPGFFEDLLTDLDVLSPVPWLYPQSAKALISAGTNQALSMAAASTDPTTDVGLLDFLRSQTTQSGVDIMVTGHSLGGALAVAAAAWLYDQMPKRDCQTFTLYPYTFAAPTVTDINFSNLFVANFPKYYAAVNAYDIVPMAWAGLSGVLSTYSSPLPSLWNYSYLTYAAVDALSHTVTSYSSIPANQSNVFSAALICNYESASGVVCQSDHYTSQPNCDIEWPQEAAAMHSMQCVYFHNVVGSIGPALPGVTTSTFRRPQSLARHGRRLLV